MRAVAQNGKAAQLMGINLKRLMDWLTIGITLVGLAGLLLSPIYPAFPLVDPTSALWLYRGGTELTSIPGAIMGGCLLSCGKLADILPTCTAGSIFPSVYLH